MSNGAVFGKISGYAGFETEFVSQRQEQTYDKEGYKMSKYNALWKYVQQNGNQSFKLTFDEIKDIAGIPIDHSFLQYKKELMEYGYQVGKISLKEQTVIFNKIV